MTNTTTESNIINELKSIRRHSDKVHGKITIVYDAVEKSMNRNYRKLAKQMKSTFQNLLTECGGGSTQFAYSKDNSIEAILHKANKDMYPKEVSRYVKPHQPLIVA